MTSIIRSAATAGAAFVLVGGLALGGTQLASPAAAATPSSTPAASTATPAPSAPSSTATPAPSAPSSAAGVDTSSSDPSLAVQDANGNHAMGSTIAANDPAAAPVGTTGATTVSPKTAKTALVSTTTSAVTKRAAAATTVAATKIWPSGLKGLDVSGYQSLTSANWTALANSGAKFAYVKATEGTTYTSGSFASQYGGAYAAGMIRGAYTFATPNTSSGATQASYFVAHGGTWSPDGRTLPPLLDIEYGYNGTCWGLSTTQMVNWIASFSNTVLAQTGIRPAIYTTANWWNQCTGSSTAFSANPFFVAQYPTSTTASSQPASLGASWSTWAFWQWSSTGPFAGDSDVFNGSATALTLLAKGGGASVPLAAPNAGAILPAGARLNPGGALHSSNGQYVLTMQTDGNLVVRGNGRLLWQTGTSHSPRSYAIMQSDGNLVLYSAANAVLWVTNTDGYGASPQTILQSNGDLQVTTSNGVAWRNGSPGTSSITAGVRFAGGQFVHDATGLLQAMMQTDGNFVLYISGRARFNTHTNGATGATIELQSDGNLVLRDPSRKPLWSTNTARAGAGSTLSIQADGNLVLRSAAGNAMWSTRTHI